jgi:hypothetical protein
MGGGRVSSPLGMGMTGGVGWSAQVIGAKNKQAARMNRFFKTASFKRASIAIMGQIISLALSLVTLTLIKKPFTKVKGFLQQFPTPNS